MAILLVVAAFCHRRRTHLHLWVSSLRQAHTPAGSAGKYLIRRDTDATAAEADEVGTFDGAIPRTHRQSSSSFPARFRRRS